MLRFGVLPAAQTDARIEWLAARRRFEGAGAVSDGFLEESIRREMPGLGREEVRELAIAVKRLIAALRPERIYVFGSRARGTARPESDVDLLVVVPASDLPAHRRDQLAHQAVGLHLLPMDILVLTRNEFERRREVPASLPATVLREGRILYAA